MFSINISLIFSATPKPLIQISKIDFFSSLVIFSNFTSFVNWFLTVATYSSYVVYILSITSSNSIFSFVKICLPASKTNAVVTLGIILTFMPVSINRIFSIVTKKPISTNNTTPLPLSIFFISLVKSLIVLVLFWFKGILYALICSVPSKLLVTSAKFWAVDLPWATTNIPIFSSFILLISCIKNIAKKPNSSKDTSTFNLSDIYCILFDTYVNSRLYLLRIFSKLVLYTTLPEITLSLNCCKCQANAVNIFLLYILLNIIAASSNNTFAVSQMSFSIILVGISLSLFLFNLFITTWKYWSKSTLTWLDISVSDILNWR